MDILQVLRKIELKINSYNRIDVEKKKYIFTFDVGSSKLKSMKINVFLAVIFMV